ncbi:MAG: OsmC family protein [Solirubrobacterales bacterium]|nr:OsmC family protein [Solirubrobacterales bacterium]
MKAIARRSKAGTYQHDIAIREHSIATDEPGEAGGDNTGPSPQELLAASLASCTAITVEMYAKRKGWEIDPIEVEVEYLPAERGSPTSFTLKLVLPSHLDDEQVGRLRVIAAKCPVHRILDGEVMFDEIVEQTPAA